MEKKPKPVRHDEYVAEASISVSEDTRVAFEESGVDIESVLEDCELPVDIDGIRFMIRPQNVSKA